MFPHLALYRYGKAKPQFQAQPVPQNPAPTHLLPRPVPGQKFRLPPLPELSRNPASGWFQLEPFNLRVMPCLRVVKSTYWVTTSLVEVVINLIESMFHVDDRDTALGKFSFGRNYTHTLTHIYNVLWIIFYMLNITHYILGAIYYVYVLLLNYMCVLLLWSMRNASRT